MFPSYAVGKTGTWMQFLCYVGVCCRELWRVLMCLIYPHAGLGGSSSVPLGPHLVRNRKTLACAGARRELRASALEHPSHLVFPARGRWHCPPAAASARTHKRRVKASTGNFLSPVGRRRHLTACEGEEGKGEGRPGPPAAVGLLLRPSADPGAARGSAAPHRSLPVLTRFGHRHQLEGANVPQLQSCRFKAAAAEEHRARGRAAAPA